MPDPLDLDAIEKRFNAALPSPWDMADGWKILGTLILKNAEHRATAEWMAHRRIDGNALVARVRELEEGLRKIAESKEEPSRLGMIGCQVVARDCLEMNNDAQLPT